VKKRKKKVLVSGKRRRGGREKKTGWAAVCEPISLLYGGKLGNRGGRGGKKRGKERKNGKFSSVMIALRWDGRTRCPRLIRRAPNELTQRKKRGGKRGKEKGKKGKGGSITYAAKSASHSKLIIEMKERGKRGDFFALGCSKEAEGPCQTPTDPYSSEKHTEKEKGRKKKERSLQRNPLL